MIPYEQLTPIRQTIVKFFWQYFQKYGRPPAYREIEDAADFRSVSTVKYHVDVLEKSGYLSRDGNLARGLSFTAEAARVLENVLGALVETAGLIRFPIRGEIVAGEPVNLGGDRQDATDEEDTIALDPSHLPKRVDDLYALRVHGNSMIDALVNDGDIVILKKVHEAANGDMVAAWLPEDDEMTLKHVYFEEESIRLQPANPTLDPIYVHPANLEIHGKVMFVHRQI